jgi:protein TonB
MSKEEKRNSGGQIGTLGGCLIEGDSEQKARERKIKRRALAISIVLQSLVLVGLVLTPLLGKTEKLPFTIVTPMPPYRSVPNKPVAQRPPAQRPPRPSDPNTYAPSRIPPRIVTQDHPRQNDTASGLDSPDLSSSIPVPGVDGGTKLFDGNRAPNQPDDSDKNKKKRISVGGSVQQAMLVRRVEPIYPPLARQIRHSGQVRLHALIAVDGTIASLEVMDGDPLLVRSALDAVGQWRYRPTLLNGSAVEVETVITVVYTLSQ